MEVVFTDIPRYLLQSGKITYYFMDVHGNWMFDFPDKSYTIPPKQNKDKAAHSDQIERDVTASQFTLTTTWGALKQK